MKENLSKPNKEETPFKFHLDDTQYGHEYGAELIKKFSENPNKLIRIHGFFDVNDKEILGKRVDGVKRGWAVLDELSKQYHIAMPKAELILGKNEGRPAIFTIVERIHGENLDKMSQIPAEAAEKMDILYGLLAHYYLSIFVSGGDYWDDLSNSQFMWGHIAKEKENKIYLVDIEPRYKTHKKGDAKIFDMFYTLVASISELENKLSIKKMRLEHAREAIKDVFDKIMELAPDNRTIPYIQKEFNL